MKKIKFAIVGVSKRTGNTNDLAEEIERQGHSVELVNQRYIYIQVDKNGKFEIFHKNKNINECDIFIFRAYSNYLTDSLIMAEKLAADGKIVIDKALSEKFLPSKIFEASRLTRMDIPYVKSIKFVNFLETGEDGMRSFNFPVIIKDVFGRKGKNIFKFETIDEVRNFFKEDLGGYMIQEYVPIDFDLRVFVVGDNAIGAMKRYVKKGDFRSNIAIGAEAEKYKINSELEKLAVKATKAMNYDIAGVDIIEKDGEYCVLEVNSSPQWQGFKEITGINPAKYIVDYAITKYKNKKNEL